FLWWSSVPSLLLSVVMIAGAIGMLRLRSWGWYLTLAWALTSCAFVVLSLVVNFGFVNPALESAYGEVLAEVPPPRPGQPDMRAVLEKSLQGGGIAGLFLSTLFLLYPVVMLVLICLPAMRKAFRPEAPPLPGDSTA